jgi:hypothetical protein
VFSIGAWLMTLILKQDLKSYFYEGLSQINAEILSPLPTEFIDYSCGVLESYSNSDRFDHTCALGLDFLKSFEGTVEKKRETLKVIGDKSLLLTSFYADSIKRKIVDKSYYLQLGKTAYSQLHDFYPTCYRIPAFFKLMSTHLEILSALCLRLSIEMSAESESDYYLKVLAKQNEFSYIERLILKIDKSIDIAS